MKRSIAILFVVLFIGCSDDSQIIEAPVLEQGLREHLDQQKKPEAIEPKIFTDEQLEDMASHEPRAGIGMNFYYNELRKRNDAEWAKEELERRKASR